MMSNKIKYYKLYARDFLLFSLERNDDEGWKRSTQNTGFLNGGSKTG